MSVMSIGAVAKQAGVRPSAVRYYESLGLIPAPARAGGKRRYEADAVMRLKAITLFKRAGFTIAELQLLLQPQASPDPARLDGLAIQKLRALDELVARVAVMREVLESVRACGCLRLEECPLLESL